MKYNRAIYRKMNFTSSTCSKTSTYQLTNLWYQNLECLPSKFAHFLHHLYRQRRGEQSCLLNQIDLLLPHVLASIWSARDIAGLSYQFKRWSTVVCFSIYIVYKVSGFGIYISTLAPYVSISNLAIYVLSESVP